VKEGEFQKVATVPKRLREVLEKPEFAGRDTREGKAISLAQWI
jgi:hypothetical protein